MYNINLMLLLLQTCMLRCRNYIEETMFRPRVLESKSGSEDADTKSSGARRQARAAGGKNHMFVRVGKPYDSESENFDMEKRSPQMKGSFVRIGRQMSEQSAGDDSRLLDG
jgi:hypothetical protein